MKKRINIAIDGPSGSGKSSTAKRLAEELEMHYLDTGQMYRAVTFWYIEKLDEDETLLSSDLERLKLDVTHEKGKQSTLIDGYDPGKELYTNKINSRVSYIASQKEVRDYLQSIQKQIAKSKNYIMDGRDIATVIMPDAELKIYLHAPLETRANRRLLELAQKGISSTFDDVYKNLKQRDEADSNREHSPLIRHQDAIVVNTGNFSFDEQVEFIKKLAEKCLYEN